MKPIDPKTLFRLSPSLVRWSAESGWSEESCSRSSVIWPYVNTLFPAPVGAIWARRRFKGGTPTEPKASMA